ncbi:MAG: carboxypeptidase-like regulatory domain-containing protein [Candidatus Aenigmatarchaeota archaeon]
MIAINKDNLEIYVGNTQATITAITPISNYFNVAILAPDLSSGSYTLSVLLLYKNYSYTNSKTIDYIVPVSGKIVDENEKGVAVQLRFLLNNVEKLRLYTDSSGDYSGNLPPDTYDIQAIFPQSTLYLYDVRVSSFENPIKYYYLISDVPGLNLVGLYVYEAALTYSKVSIEMKYDERNVLNENLIKVYRCENWNTGRKECYSNWEEISASVDTIRNTVYVNTTSLSAYAIGTLKQLSIDFNLNKQKFYLKDLVKLKGMVLDENRNSVSNSSVRVYGKNITSVKSFSDSNGVFSIEFLSPEQEGNYTLFLSAEKHPYLSFNSSIILEVVKSREISIVFPETVKIKQGENLTQDFTLVNTGQTDLYNLNISLTGIPSEYYTLIPNVEKLDVGKEIKLSIYFSIPSNVSKGTSSATLKVFNDEVSKEKIFGFTIVEKNQTVVSPAPVTGLFGKISIPPIQDIIYVAIFAATSFFLVLILKRRKIKNGREEIKNLLFDIKNYIKKRENERSFNKKLEQETPKTSSLTVDIEKESQEDSKIDELRELEKVLGDNIDGKNY